MPPGDLNYEPRESKREGESKFGLGCECECECALEFAEVCEEKESEREQERERERETEKCACMPREKPVGEKHVWHCEPSHAPWKSDGLLLTVAGGQLAPSVAHFKAVLAILWPEILCVTAVRGSVRSLTSEFSNTRSAGAGTPVPSVVCS